jgi:acetoin utilization deacetylase AcuC-like enzyme
MGFCVLNNAALAAEYLLHEEGAERVAIVDIDVHHGNGTHDIFYKRSDVLYVSTHQFPHYPFRGRPDERGDGDGLDATLNVPIPAYTGDAGYMVNMEELVLPMLGRYKPEIVLVSAGFDGHWTDPMARQLLTADGYANLVSRLTTWADENCEGKIALILEGGYDLEALGACALAATQALLGQPWDDPLGASPYAESDAWKDMLVRLKRVWSKFTIPQA